MHNREAVGGVVEALRSLGRLEPVDEALVAAAESLATQVDEHPTDPALWREYRAAESALRKAGEVVAGDAFAELLAGLSAEMGDESNGSKVVGPAGSSGSGTAGATVDAVATPRRRRGNGDKS